jgi:hypothetical protein
MTLLHKHHIVPRHMGGTDDKSNIKELTVEEHAQAHLKLYKQHGLWQDKLAYEGLIGLIPHAEMAREASRRANLGRKWSKEVIEKRAAANRGKKRNFTPEWKEKIGLSRRGKTYPKLSQAKKGTNLGNNGSKGYKWFNNGKISKYCLIKPEGFVEGRGKLAWQ